MSQRLVPRQLPALLRETAKVDLRPGMALIWLNDGRCVVMEPDMYEGRCIAHLYSAEEADRELSGNG